MDKEISSENQKMDKLTIEIDMPGVKPKELRNLQVFASFDYLLSEKLQIEMKGMLHVNLDTPNGMARGMVTGELKFDQENPILIDSIKRTIFNRDPLDPEVYKTQGLSGILNQYNDRTGKLSNY